MELNCEPSEVFHSEKNWAPLFDDPNSFSGYVTCRTGPGGAVVPGAGELGNGSATNARLSPPFVIRPLLRDQPEVMKDCVSELEAVAVGKGMEVLVVSEYCEARADGGASCATASRGETTRAHARKVLDIAAEIMYRRLERRGRLFRAGGNLR